MSQVKPVIFLRTAQAEKIEAALYYESKQTELGLEFLREIEKAIELAKEISKFPQTCMRNDRISAYEQWNMSIEDALANETKRGLEAIKQGETLSGATRFTEGEGKHGKFSDQ